MTRKIKPLIYIFCEGESEIAYAKCLKDKFSDVAVIKKPVKGLFTEAESKFKKEARYRNNAEVTDEIWFFFDVDQQVVNDPFQGWRKRQRRNGLNEVKASVFRRWPVTKAYSRSANHPLDGWC